MDHIPFSEPTWGKVATHGAVAFFGALTHASYAHRRGESKGVVDFLLLTFMSSFSGVIFALVAIQAFDNQYMTLAVTGAGGFLGVEGLTLLVTKLREVLFNLLK